MNEFYRRYLDESVARRGTDSVKWDRLEACFGQSDLEAAWLADMDFRTVPAVQEAIVARAQHGVYGYTDCLGQCREAEIGWLKRRSGFECRPEWMLYSPGVLNSLNVCIQTLTSAGDRVLIQPPVYARFYSIVEGSGRRLVTSPLIHRDDEYGMDFADLQRKFAQGVRLMLLCSPHNPVGRVWTREELVNLLSLANRYGVVIVADEIHADLVMVQHMPHTRLLSLAGAERCVMLTSPSKSFNLSGLHYAMMIVRDEKIRGCLAGAMKAALMTAPDLFSAVAARTAYSCGDEWMDAVVEYIRENRDAATAYVAQHIPALRTSPQQGTYLLWLDFSRTGLTQRALSDLLLKKARVALADGRDFGAGGEMHYRLNLAMPRERLMNVLDRLCEALKDVKVPPAVPHDRPGLVKRALRRVRRCLKRH